MMPTIRPFRLKRSFILMAVVLGGCGIAGPDFHAPKPDTPSNWAVRIADVANSAAPAEDWWRGFHDGELSSLIARAGSQNLDLQEAGLRIAEARVQERIAAADLSSALGANASYANTRFSETTAQGGLFNSLGSRSLPGVPIPRFPNPYDQFQTGFDASWEPDLFGGVHRSMEAASANTQASLEQRRDALVSVEAEIARAYVDLRGAQLKLSIVGENLNAQRETLALTKDRLAARQGSELDVTNAAAQATATQSEMPALQRQIDTDINQLSLLLAQGPDALRPELEKSAAIPPVPPQVPVGLPADLTRRRPDIRAAEARLHAATARVGVAVADLYPSIRFDAPFGLQSERVAGLASWASAFYSIGPTISIPIFEGGRLRATVELRETEEKEAGLDYAKTVLGALHDVENALIAYSGERQHRQLLEATLAQNQDALSLATDRYRSGVASFLVVLDAERTLLATELALADSTEAASIDLIALYKALGGGWQPQEASQK